MSSLRLDTYTMPAADLGPENPLPQLRFSMGLSSAAHLGEFGTAGQLEYPEKGKENNILPYRLQDGYNREKKPRTFKTAVLENDQLKATFLLEVGGRLLSLIHKPTGRELLYVNPVFQPAHFAVRDAWITGGVEWNVGIFGHCPLTCSPLFAAKINGDNGEPILRLYELERVRRVVFQVDFSLPEGSEFLQMYVRIVNPHDYAIPMYWWSNIAVWEEKGHRVLSPATEAGRHEYDGRIVPAKVPNHSGWDATYPTNYPHASDLYFKIPDQQRKWIASLDEQGKGLIQSSTAILKGRKLWVWGQFQGDQHWQEFLADEGEAYIEIQAGLAYTQAEYMTMPANTNWSWVEVYGLEQADPKVVHGEWTQAVKAVDADLENRYPAAKMEALHQQMNATANQKPVEILFNGSGWGAVERHVRQKAKLAALPEALPFGDDSLTDEQSPWMALLSKGELPYRKPTEEPGAYMVQQHVEDALQAAVNAGKGDNWLSWFHLGVMRRRRQDMEGAKAAFTTSNQREKNCWATRCLADMAAEANDPQAAADLWLEAAKMRPGQVQLVIEASNALLLAGRPVTLLGFYKDLPPQVRAHGRVQLLEVTAKLELGDLHAVEKFYKDHEGKELIANLFEGEQTLSDVWFAWQEKVLEQKTGHAMTDEEFLKFRQTAEVPFWLDYRMRKDVVLSPTVLRAGRRVKEKMAG